MHVSTKDSSKDGSTHTLTSVLEADGANELASIRATLSGRAISVERTSSGGIEVVTEVRVSEPAAEPAVELEAKPAPPEPTTIWGKVRSKKQ